MLRCEDCGERFSSPKMVSESRGEFWGSPAYEEVPYCPYCGSDDFCDENEIKLPSYIEIMKARRVISRCLHS